MHGKFKSAKSHCIRYVLGLARRILTPLFAVVLQCIPNLFYSLAAEQLFGIMLDFALPMMFLAQLSDEDEGERAKKVHVFLMPAAAHIFHLFGTILPLVLAIFLSGHVSWFSNFFLEILINLCVPVTHYLYCAWSFDLDELNDELEVESSKSIKPKQLSDRESVAGSKIVKALRRRTRSKRRTRVTTFFGKGIICGGATQCNKKSGLLPQEYRIKNVPAYLVTGFVLGLITLGL